MPYNDCVSSTVAYISDLDEEGNRYQFWKSGDQNRLSAFSSNGRYLIDYVLLFYNKDIHYKETHRRVLQTAQSVNFFHNPLILLLINKLYNKKIQGDEFIRS